ncbi:MAG: cation diffusion facilitator family transporter [Bdellovibrionales bacterium]|jgi:cation diffusion facilitator family transporter
MHAHAHSHEKQNVALSSMVASALMTIGKLIVGLSTGSLGILSEALHSFLDFGATIITYAAVRVSDKPADDDHPYGHGKIESVAALAETALLFITSFWIIKEAAHRILSGNYEVEATWWSIAVILASIAIDFSRARALKRVAKKTNSQALAADALHFSSDILSSAVVLVGLGFVAIGWPIGDPIAAIGVSFFVCHAGWVLGRSTIDTLVDAAPSGSVERITAIIGSAKGVADVNLVRVRPVGSVLFVEADIAVSRSYSQPQVAGILKTIEGTIKAEMPEAEVSITTHPLALDTETVHQRVTAIAASRGANVHHITAHHSGGRLFVSFDLEVEENLSIRAAHDVASLLEADIRAEFGDVIDVETHIEPFQDKGVRGEDVDADEFTKVSVLLEVLIRETGILGGMHKLRVRKTEHGLIVIFHCRTSPERSVADVHKVVDALECKFQTAFPGVWRMVAHTEPEIENEPLRLQ